MKGYEENLKEAETSVMKLIEELDVTSDDRIRLMARWLIFKESIEFRWKCAHPRYKED